MVLAADESHAPLLAAEMLEVVIASVSRFLGETADEGLSCVSRLNRMLGPYANTAIVQDATVIEPPGPPLPERGWPTGERGLRAAGLEREELTELWREAVDGAGVRAVLPIDVVAHFVPEALWRAVALLIEDGPAVAADRLDRASRRLARDRVPPTIARPGDNTLSRGSVRAYGLALRQLMRALVWMQNRGYDSQVLAPWVAMPPPGATPGVPANTDRSGPPRQLLRLAWRTLERDLLSRLNCSRDDVGGAIERRSFEQLRYRGVHLALRDLVALSLFIATGARVRALCRVQRKHFALERPRVDGTLGPALCIFPRKSMGWWAASWKPLPAELAQLVLALIKLVDKACGPQDEEAPVFIGEFKLPLKALSRGAMSERFAGSAGTRPVMPRDPAVIGIAAKELSREQKHGYSPHALRHAADQLARAVAATVEEKLDTPLRADQAGDVLLDHDIPSDPHGYGGVSGLRDREKITQLAAEEIWRLLTTDAGSRKIINVERLRQALELRAALEQRLQDMRRAVDRRHDRLQKAVTRRRGGAAPEPAELLELVGAQTEVAVLTQTERRLVDRLGEVEHQIDRLKMDQATRIALPDDAPPEAAVVDVERLEFEIDGSRDRGGRRTRRLRSWCTPLELAEVSGNGASTVRKWIAGQRLPHPAGDARNPWPSDDIPVDRSWGHRRTRIFVGRINRGFLTETQWEHLEELLTGWPKGWGDPPNDAAADDLLEGETSS